MSGPSKGNANVVLCSYMPCLQHHKRAMVCPKVLKRYLKDGFEKIS
jgi:hypothetical protein